MWNIEPSHSEVGETLQRSPNGEWASGESFMKRMKIYPCPLPSPRWKSYPPCCVHSHREHCCFAYTQWHAGEWGQGEPVMRSVLAFTSPSCALVELLKRRDWHRAWAALRGLGNYRAVTDYCRCALKWNDFMRVGSQKWSYRGFPIP